MTRRGERRLAAALWTLFAALSAGGLGLLAFALFSPRPVPALPELPADARLSLPEIRPADPGVEALARRTLTRRVAERPREEAPAAAGPVPIDSLLKLKGILDFGGKQPSLAVIEILGDRKTKAYQAGDKLGGSGAVLRQVGDSVIVEYDRRRYKLGYKGAREIPANSVGDNR